MKEHPSEIGSAVVATVEDPGSEAFREPTFSAPWEAKAFALALTLSSAGHFSWPEWSAALSEELSKNTCIGGDKSYYEKWLDALQRILEKKGTVSDVALARRKIEWIEAYESTPHGQPVALSGNSA